MADQTALPVSTPSEQGVDPAGVQAFLDVLEEHPTIEPHSVMLLRHGQLIASGWWRPYTAPRPGLLYSLSKSFTATALGVAVGEGLVDLDAPVLTYFPEIDVESVPERARRRTVREVVSMRTGHRRDTWTDALAADPADPVAGFLRLPVTDEPGATFTYNQPPVLTIATIVQRQSGQTVTDYLRPRLLDPLGIGTTAWLQYPPGQDLGFSGLFAPTDAIARLGELCLRDGMWQGRRLLPAGWAALAGHPHSATPREPAPDWRRGYGFGFWMSQHGYRGDGAWGQYCLVLPEQDAVVVVTSATQWMQHVMDAVWTHLLPAMTDATEAPTAADHALADRLGALALPPEPNTSWAPDTSSWPVVAFTPVGGTCEVQPSLTEVRVGPEGTVVLVEDGEQHVARFGADGDDVWIVPAAGRTDDDTFVIDLVFVQSPHRLLLVCDRRNGTFTASWATRPLHAGVLHLLRAPVDGSPTLIEHGTSL